MIHKWLEEWYDTLLYLGLVIGALVLFLSYWNGAYQASYAEIILEDFLSDAAVKGKVTLEMYEEMVRNLSNINPDYEVDIVCTEFELQPVYSLIPEEKLLEYYLDRNVKTEQILPDFEPVVEEETAELLCLQTETNSTIMAAEQQKYLPLPEENTEWSVEAVRPYQEVYEGEALITLCCVSSQDGSYYVEAMPAIATTSGTVLLQLSIKDEIYQIPVEVLCQPRKVICKNGHEVVNSKSILEGNKKTGDIKCPYCAILPEYIKCSASVIQKKTGEKLEKEEIQATVMYLDGHVEQITPESEEWLDSYDENYCGIQQVTIRYRGKEDTVIVVAENNNCQQCNKTCNERCYEDYIIFPYCTGCMSDVALFTGEVYEEENWISKGEMIVILDEAQEMVLQAGDLITVYLSAGEKYITLLQKEITQNGRTGERE